MRRPRGPFSHMPARETSLDVRLGVHRPLGPPGPTHANYAHNTRLAPEQLGVLWPNRGASAARRPQSAIHVNLLLPRHRNLGAAATLKSKKAGHRPAFRA